MDYCKRQSRVNKNGSCSCRSTPGLHGHDVGCRRQGNKCKGDNPCPSRSDRRNDREEMGRKEQEEDEEEEEEEEEECCPPITEIDPQEREMCGVHAINNLFGNRSKVNGKKMDKIAEKIRNLEIKQLVDDGAASLDEAKEILKLDDYGQSIKGGQYDIRVVKDVIEQFGDNLVVTGIGYDTPDIEGVTPSMVREDLEVLLDPSEPGLIGYIVQIGNKDRGHFICVKACGYQWCYIDSAEDIPGAGPIAECLNTQDLIATLREVGALGYIKVSRQQGGYSQSDYYKKYLKYKNRYLRLRRLQKID